MNIHKFLISLNIFSIFIVFQINAQSPVASIDFTSGNTVATNMSLFVSTNLDAITFKAVEMGVNCIGVPALPSQNYAYFIVNSGVVNSSVNNMLVEITYLDSGTDNLVLQYNSTNNPYQICYIQKNGSNLWTTTSVYIADASFKGTENNGADLRIGSNTSTNVYISNVSITLVTMNPNLEPVISGTGGSSYSEFSGKTFAGYQGWFGTGSLTGGWNHWSRSVPAANNITFDLYPDVSSYADTSVATSKLGNFGNGSPSVLFNSQSSDVINNHFGWMEKYGIDGVAIQRFPVSSGMQLTSNPAIKEPVKIMKASEKFNRVFYIMYDIAGADSGTLVNDIEFDWVYNVERSYSLITSPAYATLNGKPVICLCGFGIDGRPGTPAQAQVLLNFFHNRGCYVILSTMWTWRSLTAYQQVFLNADMISPWTVGTYVDSTSYTSYFNNVLIPDYNYCKQNNIKYFPVIFPGFSWSLWNGQLPNLIPRKSGTFFWQQASGLKNLGMSGMYIAMFDEYDEGTAITKSATDYFDIPNNQFFITNSVDGNWLSSDFYLRTAGAAIQMMKGKIAQTTIPPVAYSLGPIYYRNSFESRYVVTADTTYKGTYHIDPCFKNPAIIIDSNINNPLVAIVNQPSFTHSGIYSVEITGNPISSSSSKYYYKIADTKIGIKNNMQLSFWKYCTNNLGQYTSVDLMFKSGSYLHNLTVYKDNNGNTMSPTIARGTVGAWKQFTCQLGKGELIGDTITGIMIAYDHPVASGSINAYFDDVIVQDAIDSSSLDSAFGGTPWPIPGKIAADNFNLGSEGLAYHDVDSTNDGGQYRLKEAVDVETCSEGGYDIGYTNPGEWMNYSVNVLVPGTYTLQLRVASPSSGNIIHVEMNGVNITGSVIIPNTGGWQNWQTVNITTPELSVGTQIMRIYEETGGYNIEYLNFNLSGWIICSGSNTMLIAATPQNNNLYQWQVNNSSAYNNISNDSLYEGTTTDTLLINNVSSSMYGSTYRCAITNNSVVSYSPSYPIQFVDTWTGAAGTSLWETPSNWSCNIIPDMNTDVIINSGTVTLSSNAVIRSLSVGVGVSLTINKPYTLNVNH